MWEHWRFKYLTLFILSLMVASYLAGSEAFHNWVLSLGSFEYLGSLIAGIFFVSSFTVAVSTVMIAILSDNIHPIVIGIIGGVGAMVGDLLIFKFVKDHLSKELELLFGKRGTSYVKSVVKSKYIAWTLPIIGMFIIASPLPDEIGVSLLGLSKISDRKFMLLSFISNAAGILMIASVARVL